MKPSRRNFLLLSLLAGSIASSQARASVIVADTLLVDLRADDPSAATPTWTNSGELDDFTIASGAPAKTTIDGVDFVRMNPDTQYAGPFAPSSVAGAESRSVEVWVRNESVDNEDIMVAWGKRGAELRNYAFTYGSNVTWGALGGWAAGDVDWNGAPAAGELHHLVITYDGGTTRLYANGELKNSRDHALNTFDDPNRFIINGAWEGGTAEGNFIIQRPNVGPMDYAVVRVHSGALSADEVQANFSAGVAAKVIQGNEWVGTTNSAWDEATNWSFGTVPDGTEPLIFGNAGASGEVNLGAANRSAPRVSLNAATSTTFSGTGALTLDGGEDGASIAVLGLHTMNSPLRLESDTELAINGSASTLTFNGNITDDGTLRNLTKSGTGTLLFSGEASNGGSTIIAAGELAALDASFTSPVTIGSGARLTGNGRSAGGTMNVAVAGGGRIEPGDFPGIAGSLRLSSLELAPGSVLSYDFSFGINDEVLIDGQLIAEGAGFLLYEEGTDLTFTEIGTYTLMSFGSALADPADFEVLNKIPGRNYEFALTGNSLTLTITAGPIWDGGGADPNWSSAQNWGGVPATNGNTLVFADSFAGEASTNDLSDASFGGLVFNEFATAYQITGNAITLTGDAFGNAIQNLSASAQIIGLPIQVASPDLGIDTTGAPITLSGALSGTGGIVKSGAQPLTLSGTNTLSGGIRLNSGPLVLASAGALGNGPVTFAGGTVENATGAPLVVAGNPTVQVAGNVNFTGSPLDFGSGNLSVLANSNIALNNGGITVGSLSGGFNLTKNGPATLHLNGSGGTLNRLLIEAGRVTMTSGDPQLTLTAGESFGIRGANARLLMDRGVLNINNRWRFGFDDGEGSAIISGGVINHTANEIDFGFNGGQAYMLLENDAVYNGNGRLLKMGEAWQSNTHMVIRGNAGGTFGDIWVGAWNSVPNSLNTASLSVRDGGVLNANNLLVGREVSGTGDPATVRGQFNQEGGTTTVNTLIRIADNRRENGVLQGTLNLHDGILRAPQIIGGGGGGTASFNLHGGTLAYNGAGPQSDFLRLGETGRVVVYGDTVIDTGEHEVAIGDALLGATGGGVAGILLSNGGSNYRVPPAVTITGDGTGATAVAELDAETGTLTGIRVTNPGTGYTTPPTVTLSRGVGGGALIQAMSNQVINSGSLGAAADTVTFQGTQNVAGALAGGGDTAISFTREQQATVPNLEALNPDGPFTVEAWLRPSQADGATTSPIASFKEADGTIGRHGWLIYEFGNKWNFRTYAGQGTDTAVNIYSNDEIVNDTWYHVVATWDGDIGRMYVNGVLQNEVSPSVDFVPNRSTELAMGSRGFQAFGWAGAMDEVAIYPQALDEATVSAHYANGVDAERGTPYDELVEASSPVGYWSGDVELTGSPGVSIADNGEANGGITKVGSGRLILNGMNTYRGDTVVNEGVLELTQPTLADGANVIIANGATLELSHGATDTVAALVISGTSVEEGEWGSPESGAPNTSPQLAGTGRLLVTGGTVVPDSPFTTWINSFPGLSPADRALSADPDGDGVSNLLEFALNGDPTDGSSNGLHAVLVQDTNATPGEELTLVAAVRRGATFAAGPNGSVVASRDGVNYSIQGSENLDEFNATVTHVGSSDTAPAVTGLPSLAGSDWQYHTFRLEGSDGLDGAGFLRVSVSAAP